MREQNPVHVQLADALLLVVTEVATRTGSMAATNTKYSQTDHDGIQRTGTFDIAPADDQAENGAIEKMLDLSHKTLPEPAGCLGLSLLLI